MLQQTRVETVIPYYNRWMQQCVPNFPKATLINDALFTRFPTVRDLAASNQETINGLWKGLGYYGRAARLLSGAQTVVETYGGHLPEDPAVLEKQIAGIGKYTAGAITSIAYGVCAPVVRPLGLSSQSPSSFCRSIIFSLGGWKCGTASLSGPRNPCTSKVKGHS